jgi:DNA polymerase V
MQMNESSLKQSAERAMALVDVNNFYVSCERVFNPKLRNRPVVVLSNNDGCIISRSAEAKTLGIPMGAPWFKVRKFAEQEGVIAYSSNYALYADMSNRVMSILRQFSPAQEVYSIDESFLDFSAFATRDLTSYAAKLRKTVLQSTGLPVCVGIASSKTLAKLANHLAKQTPALEGVCNFNRMSMIEVDEALRGIAVSNVWGIGRNLTRHMHEADIHTAYDLKVSDAATMRQKFSVVMEKTVRELNGTACLELEQIRGPQRQILSTRSFGHTVRDLQSLEEAVTLYTARAGEKLRHRQLYAGSIYVYIRTSPFRDPRHQYDNSLRLPLHTHTNNTLHLVQAALIALRKIYRPGYDYIKAGVSLGELVTAQTQQQDLFQTGTGQEKSERLMHALDSVNKKMGRATLKLASEGLQAHQAWRMKQALKSPAYTTCWNDLLKVN